MKMHSFTARGETGAGTSNYSCEECVADVRDTNERCKRAHDDAEQLLRHRYDRVLP